MGLSGIDRKDCRFKSSGIAHFCITIASGKSTGHCMPRTSTFNIGVCNGVYSMVFRHQHSGDIPFTTTYMCMQINRASHNDFTGNIIFFVRFNISGLGNNAPIFNVNVFFLAINPVCRVVNNTTC